MSGLIVLCHSGPARMSVDSVLQSHRHQGADAAGYRSVQGQGRFFEFGQARRTGSKASRGSQSARQTAEAPPIRSHDQRWIVVLDGSLRNHATLRDYLRLRYQSTFGSDSHAETLAEVIARDGVPSTLERLDGGFAFVALDRASGTVYAARDSVGSRPLYTITDADGIGLATDIRGLAAHGYDAGEPDPLAMATWLRLGYVPSDRTLRTRLRSLPAGTLLTWNGSRSSQRSFRYRAMQTGAVATGTDVVDHFGALLDRAVRAALEAPADAIGGATDVTPNTPPGTAPAKVGLLLSSGLDSAVLAAALKRQNVRPPCYSVGVAGSDDLAAATATARLLGLPHKTLTLTLDDLLAAETALLDRLDGPIGNPGSRRLAQWLLYRFAASHADHVLSGQGADDLLGGHRRHRAEALRHRLPHPARGGLRRAAHLLGASGTTALGQTRRTLQVLGQSDWLTAYLDAREVFRTDEITQFGAGPCPEAARLFAPWLRRLNRPDTVRSDIHRSLWLDTRTRLADDLLRQDERLAALQGLGVHLPFLAGPLLDFIENGHDDWRVSPREGWRVLRAHARRVLPASIVGRRRPLPKLPNLFKDARFVDESRQRVATHLGTGLGWRIDPLVAIIGRGSRGGTAERRAWTLHSLARWLDTVRTSEATTATMAPRGHGQGLGVDADIAG